MTTSAPTAASWEPQQFAPTRTSRWRQRLVAPPDAVEPFLRWPQPACFIAVARREHGAAVEDSSR